MIERDWQCFKATVDRLITLVSGSPVLTETICLDPQAESMFILNNTDGCNQEDNDISLIMPGSPRLDNGETRNSVINMNSEETKKKEGNDDDVNAMDVGCDATLMTDIESVGTEQLAMLIHVSKKESKAQAVLPDSPLRTETDVMTCSIIHYSALKEK